MAFVTNMRYSHMSDNLVFTLKDKYVLDTDDKDGGGEDTEEPKGSRTQ